MSLLKKLSLLSLTITGLISFTVGTTNSAKASIDKDMPTLSVAESFNSDNLDILCKNSPLNSRCQDWQPLITLEDRSGIETECRFTHIDIDTSLRCKIEFVNEDIITYVEEKDGDKLVAFGGKRNTIEVSIPQKQLFARFEGKTARITDGNVPSPKVSIELGYILSSEEETDNTTRFLQVITSRDELIDQLSNIAVPDLLTPENRAVFRRNIARSTERISSSTVADSIDDNKERLIATKACVRCDLSNADLSDLQLSGANLEGANLEGANLAGTRLGSAYLVGANLSEADLTGASLYRAVLVLAVFSEKSTLKETNLSGAAIAYADLQRTDLREARLAPANSSPFPFDRTATVFAYSDLSGANLSETKPQGANFSGADLSNADLSNADFRPFVVELGPDMIVFDRENFRVASTFENANLRNADMTASNFTRARFRGANASGANLTDADLNRASLVDANLTNATFQNTQLTTIDMSGANLTGTDWSTSNLEGSTFCNATEPDGKLSSKDC